MGELDAMMKEAGIEIPNIHAGLRDIESQIQSVLDAMDEELKRKKTVPSRSNMLLAKLEMLRRLLDRRDEQEKVSRANATNPELLTAKSDLVSAQAQVTALEKELASVRALKQEVRTITIDPNAALKQERDAAITERDEFKELASVLLRDTNLPVAAIKSLKCAPPIARFVCERAGVDYDEWMSFSRALGSAYEWNAALNGARRERLCSPRGVFCLASLEAAGTPYKRSEFAEGDIQYSV
jgi:hypothetical protein